MAYDFCSIQEVEGRLCAIDSGLDKLNQGSVIEALFFREVDIISQPSYSFSFDSNNAATLDGLLVLKAGAIGYRFRFTPDTGRYSETQQENDDGVTYDQLFTLSIPKDRPEVVWLKVRMRFPRYAVIYRDANGNVKVLRHQRVKFDLNTGTSRTEYNGHILSARRLTDSPALHWSITPGATLDSIYTAASLVMDTVFSSLPEGWLVGKQISLNAAPVSPESVLVIYNQAIPLRYGEHYTVSGSTVSLLFNDDVDGGTPGTIHCFYATNLVGTAIGAFNRHLAIKSAAYTSGETITLPTAPTDSQQLLVVYNDVLSLRPGIDYTISGSTVTLLFDGDPAGDQDTFDFYYVSDTGSALAITGWKQYPQPIISAQASGYTFDLPHTPITNSLLVRLDGMILRPGTHYNLTDNEIEVLFALAADSRIDCWYAY